MGTGLRLVGLSDQGQMGRQTILPSSGRWRDQRGEAHEVV